MINFITLFDLIYIAGFLDGDGAIIAQFVTRDDYKWKYQIRLSIQFTQHTKRSIYLTKLKQIIGAGSIRHRTGVVTTSPSLLSKQSSLLDCLERTQTCCACLGLATGGPSQPTNLLVGLPRSGKIGTQSGSPATLQGLSPEGLKDSVSDYVITANLSVLAFLKLIQPYLRIKQKQANLAITILEQLPLAKNDKVKFIELVDMVDHIASLNDTKLTKRTIPGAVVKEALKNVPPISPQA